MHTGIHRDRHTGRQADIHTYIHTYIGISLNICIIHVSFEYARWYMPANPLAATQIAVRPAGGLVVSQAMAIGSYWGIGNWGLRTLWPTIEYTQE